MAGAGDGRHVSGAQVHGAHGVVLRVRHVERLATCGEPTRVEEARLVRGAVAEALVAVPDHALRVALAVDEHDAAVARVGDGEPAAREGRDAARETQGSAFYGRRWTPRGEA